MAGPDPDPRDDSGDDADVSLDRGSPPGMPLWVKAFVIVAILLVLGAVVLLLLGGHGPAIHTP